MELIVLPQPDLRGTLRREREGKWKEGKEREGRDGSNPSPNKYLVTALRS